MRSWKTISEEEKQKQQWLDEIHMRPDVKKVFTLSEIFSTINTFIALALLLVVGFGLSSFSASSSILGSLNIYGLMSLASEKPLLFAVIVLCVVGYIAVRFLQKKYVAELEKLEKIALREIEQAIADGSYIPGPSVGRGYRIFRGVRSAVLLIGCLFFFVCLVTLVW